MLLVVKFLFVALGGQASLPATILGKFVGNNGLLTVCQVNRKYVSLIVVIRGAIKVVGCWGICINFAS